MLTEAGPGDAGIAAAGATDHISEHGFRRAMLGVGALLIAGGAIGGVGIRGHSA